MPDKSGYYNFRIAKLLQKDFSEMWEQLSSCDMTHVMLFKGLNEHHTGQLSDETFDFQS